MIRPIWERNVEILSKMSGSVRAFPVHPVEKMFQDGVGN